MANCVLALLNYNRKQNKENYSRLFLLQPFSCSAECLVYQYRFVFFAPGRRPVVLLNMKYDGHDAE